MHCRVSNCFHEMRVFEVGGFPWSSCLCMHPCPPCFCSQAQCLLNVSGDAAVLIPCPPAATAATGGDITGTSQSMSTEMLPPGNQRDEAKQEAGVAGSDGGKLTVPLIAASGSAKAASSQKRKAKAVFAHRGIEKLGELSRN